MMTYSSFSNVFREAMEANNVAVGHLESGHLSEAVAAFQRGNILSQNDHLDTKHLEKYATVSGNEHWHLNHECPSVSVEAK